MPDSIHRPLPETRTVGESDGYVAAAFVVPSRFTDRSRRLAPWVRVMDTWRLRSSSRLDSSSRFNSNCRLDSSSDLACLAGFAETRTARTAVAARIRAATRRWATGKASIVAWPPGIHIDEKRT